MIANKRGVMYCAACEDGPHWRLPVRARVKPRPLVAVRGGHTRMPEGYMAWRELIRAYIFTPEQPRTGPLRMAILFRFKRKGAGDVDNLAGGIMDAFNGVIYQDDKQIEQLDVAIERHTERDEIEVSIWAL